MLEVASSYLRCPASNSSSLRRREGLKHRFRFISGAGALSAVSIGFGALSVAGGKALGPRRIVQGFVRVSDFFPNYNTPKWIAPVIGVPHPVSVYFTMDLPQSVPRNIGRKIKHNLTDGSVPLGRGQFIEAHSGVSMGEQGSA
jgi:hypothetical protein